MSIAAETPPLTVSHARVAVAARLSLPLITFLLLPNIVSLFTLSMIGHLGTAAIAGMGIANVIFGMLLALLYGFDTGLQAFVSRATGAGDTRAAGQALSDVLSGSAPLGVALAAFIFFAGPHLIALLLREQHAAAAGAALLHGLAPSAFLLALTIPFNAYWIGSGQPKFAFFVALALVPVQIAATWALVLGPFPLGTFGAGLASSVTCLCGLGLQLALARARRIRFARPDLAGLAAIAKIGWPISLQQSFLQFGLVLAYAIVSQLGVTATAILNVLVSLTTLPIQSASGMGMAAATLVGQSLGRGDPRDAERWGWQIAFAAAAIFLPFGLFAVFAPRLLLALFLTDPASLGAAVLPLQIAGAGFAVDAFVRVLNFALRGTGATKPATAIPFAVQWLVQLPLMWLVGLRLHMGMTGIVMLQVALSVAEALVFAFVWQRGSWKALQLGASARATAFEHIGRPERIVILGGAGAGKSTLARRIGDRLDLPVIHLDRCIYGPNWTRLPAAVSRAKVVAALGERWVTDGTYPQFHDLTLAHADLVLWIEQPTWKRLWRAWHKTHLHRGQPRDDRPDGCEEAFGIRSLLTVLRFGRWSNAIGTRLQQQTHGRVLRLKGDHDVRRFTETL